MTLLVEGPLRHPTSVGGTGDVIQAQGGVVVGQAAGLDVGLEDGVLLWAMERTPFASMQRCPLQPSPNSPGPFDRAP
jgi:hypothetical protein